MPKMKMKSCFYSDNSKVKSLLNVTFIKELAMDLNGVKREAFTLFWEK